VKQIDLREGARRQHRAAAIFAVIQCWLRGLDGIVFERSHLERILGLVRFKKMRVTWLGEDFKEFFPFQQVFWKSNKKNATGELNSFSSLWVSRRDFSKFMLKQKANSDKRLESLAANKDAPNMAKFMIWPKPTSAEAKRAFEASVPFFSEAVNFDERLLASYLSLLCGGQISPRSLPSLQKPEVMDYDIQGLVVP